MVWSNPAGRLTANSTADGGILKMHKKWSRIEPSNLGTKMDSALDCRMARSDRDRRRRGWDGEG